MSSVSTTEMSPARGTAADIMMLRQALVISNGEASRDSEGHKRPEAAVILG